MFDNKKVGKTIADLRREKNLTQLELADELGVSFQAVSNWERGNSMPDISKLEDLSKILGLKNEAVGLYPYLSEDTLNYLGKILAENYGLNSIVSMAPFLEEEGLDGIIETWINSSNIKEKSSEVVGLYPYLSEETMLKLVKSLVHVQGMKGIVSMAPFLENQALDDMIDDWIISGGIESDSNEIVGLYPFLSHNTLKKLANILVDKKGMKELKYIAPYL